MNSDSSSFLKPIVSSIVLALLASASSYFPSDIRSLFYISAAIVIISFLALPNIRELVGRYMDKKHTLSKELLIAQNTVGSEKIIQNIYDKQHFLIHIARDFSVKNMPIVPKYNEVIATYQPDLSSKPTILNEIEPVVTKMLQHLVDIFRESTHGEANIWACVRDRRGDDSYHTWIRVGTFDPKRTYSSTPMHKDKSDTIRALKSHFDLERKCVMVTGQGESGWEGQKNDKYKEDLSVLTGAIMTRSWQDDDWTNNCLSWIVFINADKKDFFAEAHIPTMQACVDVFSWLANSMLRSQSLENRHSVSNTK